MIAVASVFYDISERKQIEATLARSQTQLASIIDSAMDAIITVDEQQRIVIWNATAERIFGCAAAEALGQPLGRFVPARYRDQHGDHIRAFGRTGATIRAMGALQPLMALRTNGAEFPIEASISHETIEGRQLFTVILRDITERVRAETALRSSARQMHHLSRRLVVVQEAERRHLARELHDEIGQMLTGLNLLLEVGTAFSMDLLTERMHEAQALVNELTVRVRTLSLDLRPSMLDDFGLLPTLLWHIQRYTAQTQIQVDFKHNGLERQLDPMIAVAAYRVVQEALTNIARYAQVARVDVQDWAGQTTLGIQIEDQGRGFDLAAVLAARQSNGLAGMQERATLLGGQVTIDSTPGEGTRVFVELPLTVPDATEETST